MRGQGSENAKGSCPGLHMRDVHKFDMNILYKETNLEKNEKACCRSTQENNSSFNLYRVHNLHLSLTLVLVSSQYC